MAITDIPIFSMLRTKLQYSQERQRVLAENVANADTPNYRARDLKAPTFPDPTEMARPAVMSRVALAPTDGVHIGAIGSGSNFSANSKSGYEVRPTGTVVNMEDEMIKVADNQMDYQAATALYSRSLNLIKTALGKR